MGIKNILVTCTAVFLFGCSKGPAAPPVEESRQPVEYLIKKGSHYAEGNLLAWIDTDQISCIVEFDSSVIYQSLYASNQADVNKLIGFSDCGNTHHQNSARMGWSWTAKGLMLYAYCYVDGIRTIKSLGIVPLYTPVQCTISADDSHYRFAINHVKDSIARHCSSYTGARYKLFPYFGGDESAPHDIRIKITEVYPPSH